MKRRRPFPIMLILALLLSNDPMAGLGPTRAAQPQADSTSTSHTAEPHDMQDDADETEWPSSGLTQGKTQSEYELPLKVTELATSPALSNVILTSLSGSQIPIYSMHGGTHWKEVETAPWISPGTTLPLRVAIAPRTEPFARVRLIVAVPGDDPSKVGIYRTGDNGQTWAYSPIPIDYRCNEPLYFDDFVVSPADANRLYLTAYCWDADLEGARAFYSVYTSADAGINWQKIRGSQNAEVWTALATSPIVAGRIYVMNGNGEWYQSEDGGEKWSQKDFPVVGLAADSQNPQWLYGNPCKRSTDSGNTWVNWNECPCPTISKLIAHPTISNTLFILCGTGLYRSNDGGDHWTKLSSWKGQWMGADYGNPGRILWTRNDGLWATGDQGTTWAQLSDSYHLDFQSWRNISTPDSIGTTRIQALAPISSTNVWAVGESGTILNRKGNEWISIPGPVGTTLFSIAFALPNDGWAVGDKTILHWDGTAWTRIFSPTNVLRSVDVVATDDAWAVGDKGTILHWNGTAWTAASSSAATITMHLTSVDMVSSTDGWAVGGADIEPDFDIYAPVILRWNGISWSEVDVTVQAYSLILRSVDMVSETDGWIVGGGLWANSSTILRWDGTSWQEAPHTASGILTSVSMASENEGWIGKLDAVLYWDGSVWTQKSVPDSYSSHFEIWSPGAPVAALPSGETWVAQESGIVLHHAPLHSKTYIPWVRN